MNETSPHCQSVRTVKYSVYIYHHVIHSYGACNFGRLLQYVGFKSNTVTVCCSAGWFTHCSGMDQGKHFLLFNFFQCTSSTVTTGGGIHVRTAYMYTIDTYRKIMKRNMDHIIASETYQGRGVNFLTFVLLKLTLIYAKTRLRDYVHFRKTWYPWWHT